MACGHYREILKVPISNVLFTYLSILWGSGNKVGIASFCGTRDEARTILFWRAGKEFFTSLHLQAEAFRQIFDFAPTLQ